MKYLCVMFCKCAKAVKAGDLIYYFLQHWRAKNVERGMYASCLLICMVQFVTCLVFHIYLIVL